MAKGASANNYEMIVIGGGMGGLTAASILAKTGRKVLLVEKEPRPGGYVGALVHGPYEFDTAARLIMGCTSDSAFGPGPIYTLLNDLGVREQCEFIKVQPFCTMRLPGSTFQMWSGRQAFTDGLQRVFPGGWENLPRLLDLCNQIYRGVISFATSSRPWELLKIPFQFPSLIRYQNATVEDVLVQYIPESRQRTAISSLWPYLGLTPRRVSFVMWATMMASYIEEGAFFCRGGLHRLADAVAGSLVNLGGELLLECEVTKILVNNRVVRGVRLANGQDVFAPVVLCNTDCRHAFSVMIEPGQVPERYRARLEREEPSIQALDISLVTDLDLPALGFEFETLCFNSWDMEEVWNSLNTGEVGIFSLTVTTATDPSLASPGQHLVSSICGWPANVKPSPENIEKQGNRLWTKIGKHLPQLSDHLILAKNGGLPRGYITQGFGPIYGWAATPRQIGIGRLKQRTPIRGLYLVGHWAQPAHGVVTVVLSGMAVAREILRSS